MVRFLSEMKRFYQILLFSTAFGTYNSLATHIVGGDIQMQYLGTGNRYRFILNLYFDEINGNQQAEDANVVLGIYKRRNNTLVQSFTLPKTSQAQVQYQNDACQSQFLRTRLIRYSLDVDLSPTSYNDDQGYYAIWERCCRNNVISNIANPGAAGSVFYLWFPAISIGGSPFRNNSPTFSVPNGDYLCLGQDFVTTNFSATDADGDQLVYSMVTPFNGYSSSTNPNPFNTNAPLSYNFPPPTISWLLGFSATNAIPSSVGMPLSIDSNNGTLSVNPNRTGLFVFAIRCEEFRAGVKIGESRREFQFLVRECRANTPPTVSLPLPNNPSQNYVEGDTLTIDASNEANLCFNFKITDSPNENISKITARKISGNFNFRSNPFKVTSTRTNGQGVALVEFCWIKCLYSRNANDIFVFEVIVQDDACPSPGTDTLLVKLRVLPKKNAPPILSILQSTPNVNISQKIIRAQVGELVEIILQGTDANNDELVLQMLINGDTTNILGFTLVDSIRRNGFLVSKFRWQPDCRTISQNGEIQNYDIDFVLREKNNECDNSNAEISFKLILEDKPVDLSNFLPANIFTPNGDGINDEYFLHNLPEENCFYRFASIKIYNRWGKMVFESSDKNFRWNGESLPAGVYFYLIDYQNITYKGTLTIMY